jgi:hypothetical protein
MTDNVIPFSTLDSREGAKADSESAAGASKTAADASRAKSMRKKLVEKPNILRENDRIKVAQNLGRILQRMESRGYGRSQLLRDLAKGKEGDSTKQLRTYVLAADATPEKNAKQIKVLTKSAKRYLEIAEGAANVMGEDTELIALQLFADTTYQVLDEASDETIASMEQLRKLLVGMVAASTRRNDLRRYLKILEEGKIGWDIDGSFGNHASLPLTIYFRDRAARHVSYVGYAPTVFLYRSRVGPAERIKGEAFQIDFTDDPQAVENFLFEDRPLPKKHRVGVGLSIYREVWFGLAPIESDWGWKPVFEKRLSFEIRGNDGNRRSIFVSSYDPTIVHVSALPEKYSHDRLLWLHQYSLLPRKADGESLKLSVSPHIDKSESIGSQDIKRYHLEDRWLISFDPFDVERLSVDTDIEASKGQFFYETVDLASCTKYLDVVSDPEDFDQFEIECSCVSLNDRLWFGEDEAEGWYREFAIEGKPLTHANSPRGSIARAIEQNLLREDSENRLDTALFEVVAERLSAAFECHEHLLRSRDTRIANLLDSWKSK